MKKLMMLVLGGMLAAAMPLWADTGYTWTYQINGDTAEIYRPHEWSDAISPIPTGAVAMPSTLGGKPVTSIGGYAFYNYSGSGEGGGKTGGGEIADLDDWMNAVLNRRATFSLGADITIDMTRGNVVVARTWVDSGETKVMGYTDEGCKCEVDYSHPRKWSDDVYSISGTDIHSGVHTFTGMLQGNGHTLKIEGGPLFSFAKGATFENVTFDGDSISSASNCKFVGCTSKTAPLAATAEDCEFSQCVGAVSGSTQASFAKRATGCFFEGCSAQVEIAFSGGFERYGDWCVCRDRDRLHV